MRTDARAWCTTQTSAWRKQKTTRKNSKSKSTSSECSSQTKCSATRPKGAYSTAQKRTSTTLCPETATSATFSTCSARHSSARADSPRNETHHSLADQTTTRSLSRSFTTSGTASRAGASSRTRTSGTSPRLSAERTGGGWSATTRRCAKRGRSTSANASAILSSVPRRSTRAWRRCGRENATRARLPRRRSGVLERRWRLPRWLQRRRRRRRMRLRWTPQRAPRRRRRRSEKSCRRSESGFECSRLRSTPIRRTRETGSRSCARRST
mmetsp:Transcript_11731/g.29627  ORF Transcript_11731/g.29627 Transcript_11731/m.29627 type:complete len:268 (+) Transcript_11731:536-1339(+)